MTNEKPEKETPKNKNPAWLLIHIDADSKTHKMKVPGGWVVKYEKGYGSFVSVSTVFVPIPNKETGTHL